MSLVDQTETAERLRALHRLSIARYKDYAQLYADYLETGRRLLGMPTGMISQIETTTYRVLAVASPLDSLRPGQVHPLSNLYCEQVVREQRTVAHHHIGLDKRVSLYPVYASTRLECYIGSPLWVNNEVYGTLSFSDTIARDEPFDHHDIEFLDLMALALGRVIERDLHDRERELTRIQLNENIALFENAFQGAAIGMALVGVDGRFMKVNPALCSMLGYTQTELLLLDFQAVTHPDDLALDLDLYAELLEGKRPSYRLEKRYFAKDGRLLWVTISVSLIRDDQNRPRYAVSQVQDITDRKQAETELLDHRRRLEIANRGLTELVSIDPLTGLGNRRGFTRHLEDAITAAQRTAKPVSLLMIDVDHFKQYNDAFGHPAGDAALRAVARCLMRTARVSDFVARYGGEEFIVLLPDTDSAGAVEIAERLRQAIAAIDTERARITASVGASTCLPGSRDNEAAAARLVTSADAALYQAKAQGRDRVAVR